jgi:hypothetical protein
MQSSQAIRSPNSPPGLDKRALCWGCVHVLWPAEFAFALKLPWRTDQGGLDTPSLQRRVRSASVREFEETGPWSARAAALPCTSLPLNQPISRREIKARRCHHDSARDFGVINERRGHCRGRRSSLAWDQGLWPLTTPSPVTTQTVMQTTNNIHIPTSKQDHSISAIPGIPKLVVSSSVESLGPGGGANKHGSCRASRPS